VSLVPSITETLFALGRGEALVGCTLYCIEPRDALAGATRVGGEKNPDLDRIRALHPDLVLANVEENLREHVETLRGWGVAVFVSYPRTVEAGIRLIRDLGEITGAGAAGAALADSLARALAALSERLTGQPRPRVFYPIWRRPWMTVNRDTYVHDMLAVCGADNVFAALPARYPEIGLDEVAAARPDVILLPDEPYRFRRPHIADFALYPEVPAVRDGRIHLVDGKLAAWYGPRIGEALDVLPGLLGRG
jgi:ABC-type Fe3+-hydroxamate transport system substrate-binding protein